MPEMNYDELSMEGLVSIYQDAIAGNDQMTIDALHLKVAAWQKLGGDWADRASDFLKEIKVVTTVEQAGAIPGVSRLVSDDRRMGIIMEDIGKLPPEVARAVETNVTHLGFPKPRLSLQDLRNMIKSVEYHRLPDGRTTIALLHMVNGSTTVAHSQVLYAENNVPAYGDKAAYDNGVEKLWDIAGFQHYQQRYEFELVENIILPAIRANTSASTVLPPEAEAAYNQCSLAVRALISELSNERTLRLTSSSDGAQMLNQLIQDKILPAITGDTTLDQAMECQKAMQMVPEGVQDLAKQLRHALDQVAIGGSDRVDEEELVRLFMGDPTGQDPGSLEAMNAMPKHLRHMAQAVTGGMALIRSLRQELASATKHTNFELTSRVNQAAGNVPDGTDAQLRKQGGIILDEVKELLAELHMDALFRYDFVRIARCFSQLYTDSEAIRDFAEIADAAHDAEQFLELHHYQQNVIKGELPESQMPRINPYAVRGELQDVLVTTYGLAYYMGLDADEDHREVSRANMSKFDPVLEMAAMTQKKYMDLGVATTIRRTEVNWLGFQGAYYANICTDDVTGTDGKFYRKGKFLKSLRFEEPRYKPAIVWGQKEEVSPTSVLANMHPGTIEMHAPTHPGYFDDLRASKENGEAFMAAVGRYPSVEEHKMFKQLGREKTIALVTAPSQSDVTAVLSQGDIEAIHGVGAPYPSTASDFVMDLIRRYRAEDSQRLSKLEAAITQMQATESADTPVALDPHAEEVANETKLYTCPCGTGPEPCPHPKTGRPLCENVDAGNAE